MIDSGTGDLLDAQTEALVNTVNCVGVMGKGIALQFKRRYPQVFKAYKKACDSGDVRVGKMLPIQTGEMVGPQWVINFPTKQHWRSPSRLEWIEDGLSDLRRVIDELGIKSIAIPPLGAGNGGLDWSCVEPLIREAFSDRADVEVVLYAPTRGRQRNVDAVQRQLRVTRGRALVLALIDQYVAQRAVVDPTAGQGASHLEIQKLLYFATIFAPNRRMTFAQGKYGPYSEAARHALADMEGQFIEGYGDGDDKVLALRPIAVTSGGRAQMRAYLELAESEGVNRTVRDVLGTVEGFESPYGVELLATTHWVATHEGARSPQAATMAVRRWSERKGRLFTEFHVSRALEHLKEKAILE